MRIDGDWSRCDDDVLRPVVRVEVLADDGSWKAAEFLLDIGADRTVFSAAVWQLLRLTPEPSEAKLGGVGGLADSVEFASAVRLTTNQGGKVTLRGQYAGVMRLECGPLGCAIACRACPFPFRHLTPTCPWTCKPFWIGSTTPPITASTSTTKHRPTALERRRRMGA